MLLILQYHVFSMFDDNYGDYIRYRRYSDSLTWTYTSGKGDILSDTPEFVTDIDQFIASNNSNGWYGWKIDEYFEIFTRKNFIKYHILYMLNKETDEYECVDSPSYLKNTFKSLTKKDIFNLLLNRQHMNFDEFVRNYYDHREESSR